MIRRWLGGNKPAASMSGNPQPRTPQLIELRNVVKTYQSAAGAFTTLKGIDLQIEPGEFVAVIGKSGSGKSNLINMITGIDRPSSGEVLVAGAAVHTLSEGQMAIWRGRSIGVVFQFFQLLPTLTLAEKVMLPMDFCGMYTPHERYPRDGGAAAMSFDAIPGLKMPGTVSRIRALGENRQGDITYIVTLKPARHEARLRWNMTASVTIMP